MPSLKIFLLPIALLAAPIAAHAQDWVDEYGIRRSERAPSVYWDGNCRVEQRVNRDGDVIERRRCRSDRYADSRQARRDRSDDEPVRYAGDGDSRTSEAYRASRRNDDYADAEPPRDYPAPLPAPALREEPVRLAPRKWLAPSQMATRCCSL